MLAQIADERGPHGELYRYDFGNYMLKEYVAYSKQARHPPVVSP